LAAATAALSWSREARGQSDRTSSVAIDDLHRQIASDQFAIDQELRRFHENPFQKAGF
jgi:hypothetical protein